MQRCTPTVEPKEQSFRQPCFWLHCPVRVKKVPETSAQGLLLVKTRLGVLRCRQLTGTRVTKGGVPGPIWWQKAVLEDLTAGVA